MQKFEVNQNSLRIFGGVCAACFEDGRRDREERSYGKAHGDVECMCTCAVVQPACMKGRKKSQKDFSLSSLCRIFYE